MNVLAMTQDSGGLPSEQPQEVFESDGWTGGPSPEPKKGKLDKWADAHPLRFMAICILIMAAALTGNADVVHPMSFLQMAVMFLLLAAGIGVTYGSIFLGFWLLGQLVDRIDTGRMANLGMGMKMYIGLMLLAAIIADRLFAPILVGKAIAWIGGAP